MTYDEFRSQLKKKDLTQLYYFTGREDFLQVHSLSEAKNVLIEPSFEDFNYTAYIEQPTFEEADTFINAFPLMSERKLVVFNNCKLFHTSLPEKNKWEALFSSLPDYVVVLIRDTVSEKGKKGTTVEQIVKKMGTEVVCDYLEDSRLRPWLMKVAASFGKSLSDKDAYYIIKNLGQSMTLLRSEMEKICARAEEFVITREDIDSVIRNVLVESIFNLIDSVIYRRRDLAFDTLANLEKLKIEPVTIIPTFADQVLGIYKAKLMMTQKMSINEIKKTIHRNIFVADKMVQKASKITLNDLEVLISMLTDAEYKTKNGIGDAWTELYMIVAN
ncbi:MAG: DNA polymerase III subunit delta [Clostridia bacterium]|nr:DNA polymerase III subunit delta [Clostridia bacterium]